MLLNFKKQFQPLILDGSKTHSIRGERKDQKRPEPGETLHLYTGLRQRGAEFILRAPCLRTESVNISRRGYLEYISIARIELSFGEADTLAWRDGFRPHGKLVRGSFEEMMKFWKGRLPFRGWITYWDYSKADFVRRKTQSNHDVQYFETPTGKQVWDTAIEVQQ